MTITSGYRTYMLSIGDSDYEPVPLTDAPTLEDLIMSSLLSDRRAVPGDSASLDSAPFGTYRGGWWADSEVGSLLWLRSGEPMTTAGLMKVEDAARQALQWMVDAGICQRFLLEVEASGGLIRLGVTAVRGSATEHAYLWEDAP